MTLRDVISGLCLLTIFAALVGVVWGVIRSLISDVRRRGWQDRLAQPRPEEVEARWRVRLPRVLVEFYRSRLAERWGDFYPAPPTTEHPRWFIAQFIPLTRRDLGEWMTSMVPGIPIALDGNKGFYYLPFEQLRGGGSCPVLHRNLGGRWPSTDTVVAPSVEEFVQFQVEEPSCEPDEDVPEPGGSPDRGGT